MALFMSLFATSLLPVTAAYAFSTTNPDNEFDKVFVCKYVGTPGVDERLQTGDNPISVSTNALMNFTGLGTPFNDGQGRSVAIAYDDGGEEPPVSMCPQLLDDVDAIVVTPVKPVQTDITCEDAGSFTVPTTAGVVYKVDGKVVTGTQTVTTAGDVTVTAELASDEFVFSEGAQTTFTLTFKAPNNCENNNGNNEQVTLCHATGSASNPFVVITVDAAGAFNGHLGNDHQDGEDIIPPFTFQGKEYSQNFDAEGQLIFNNDCNVPGRGGITDVCPNIERVQTKVPEGFVLDTLNNCVKKNGVVLGGITGGQGQVTPPTTNAVVPAELPATGPASNIFGLVFTFLASAFTYLIMLSRQKAINRGTES